MIRLRSDWIESKTFARVPHPKKLFKFFFSNLLVRGSKKPPQILERGELKRIEIFQIRNLHQGVYSSDIRNKKLEHYLYEWQQNYF